MKTFANYLLRKSWILRIVMPFLSRKKQERIIIARFREELAFFGYSTVGISDDEIKEGIVKVGDMVGKIGFTAEEITESLKAIATSAAAKFQPLNVAEAQRALSNLGLKKLCK